MSARALAASRPVRRQLAGRWDSAARSLWSAIGMTMKCGLPAGSRRTGRLAAGAPLGRTWRS